MNGRLCRRASLFMGARLGNLEWACLLGTLGDGGKGLWRWGVSLYGNSEKGTWRAPLLGTLEERQKRIWRWASLSIGAPSTGDFERWRKGALGIERFSLKRLSAEDLW